MAVWIPELPLAYAEIKPGYILWIKDSGRISDDECRKHNLDLGARHHPCVVVEIGKSKKKKVHICTVRCHQPRLASHC